VRARERLRLRLLEETGIDMAAYRNDEVLATVSGWKSLLRLVTDGLISLSVVLLVTLGTLVLIGLGHFGEREPTLLLALPALGVGIGLLTFVRRLKATLPSEVDRIFILAERLAERIRADAGDRHIPVSTLARAAVLVGVVPAIGLVAGRRVPVVGILVGVFLERMVAVVLDRTWPEGLRETTGRGAVVFDAVGAGLADWRKAAVPRVVSVVRWATLPLFIVGWLLTGGAVLSVAAVL
jgi:hypothetical protein